MGKITSLENPTQDNNQRKNWKLIRRVTMTVALLCALTTGLFYFHLLNQFQAQQSQNHLSDQQLLKTLHSQTEQKLQQLSNIISTLEGVHQAFESQDIDQLQQTFDFHWDNIQYDWNLDIIKFYSPTDDALGSWSSRPIQSELEQKINEWVNEVNQSQLPLNTVSCLQNCSQYLITPIEINSSHNATLVISISLLDILNQFQRSTEKAVGILTPSANPEASTSILTFKWGYELYSLTNTGHNEPILQQYTHLMTPAKGIQQNLSATIDQRDYELRLYPLSSSDDSFLIILEDLTQPLNNIINITQQFALISFSVIWVLLLILQLSLQRILTRHEQARQLARIARTTLPGRK